MPKSLAVLAGALAILLVLLVQLNTMTYRHGMWYKKRMQAVKRWAKVSVSGQGSNTVTVQTTDGTFRIKPVYGIVSRTEMVPVRTPGRLSMTVAVGRTRTIVEGRLPFTSLVGDALTIDASLVEPEPPWDFLHDMEVTELGDGGLLHTDRMTAGVDVLLVPGKSSAFLSRTCLDLFRARNMRLHVVYYEDHTFARRDGHIECGFKSGSVDASVAHIVRAIKVSGATFCVGYSLGGLLLSLTRARFPSLPITAVALLNPFLAMSMHSAAGGLDTRLGHFVLRMLRGRFPRLKDDVIVPRYKSRFDYIEFMAYRHPISVRNPQADDPARFVALCSFNLIDVSIAAMLELRAAKKIGTPALLIGSTQDELCSARTNIRHARTIFEKLEVKTFSFTHNLLPAPDERQDVELLNALAEFFHSFSRDIVVGA
jgi:alpha-beta hydrolase superfamily lysophospholipase